MMKQILCYGDSNTWGYDPESANPAINRLPWAKRWPGQLQQRLGDGFHVVEEGLGGRTTVFQDPTSPGRSGLALLTPCLQSHQPLDLLIFMLGTNDTKTIYNASVRVISDGMDLLLRTALNPFLYDYRKPPQILLVSPIYIGEDVPSSWLGQIFDLVSVQKSKELARFYRALAKTYDCHFLDAAQHAAPAPGEGVHMNAQGHQALAAAMAERIAGLW